MSEDPEAREKCSWNKFSESKLITIERKILEAVKTAYKGWFVPVKAVTEEDKIWTVSLNTQSEKTPLVLLHGFAAGLGFWCMNFDQFAQDRPVYAIDLLGFGRSSRPTFHKDHVEAEKQLVESIEEWRKSVKLEKFILLGHSFGGYLATSYSIQYPEHVKHLILADPWGFTTRPPNFNPPLWVKIIAYPFMYFNPLASVRAAGPWGPWLIKKTRSDISRKYSEVLDDENLIVDYIYHCNSQTPSGEAAFHSMVKGFAFAKKPMLERIPELNKDLTMTIIYGANSWIDRSSGPQIQSDRPESFVELKVVPDAGHHIHADQPELFNEAVIEACNTSDQLHKEQDEKKTVASSSTYERQNIEVAVN